jgi:hypothetical protein
MAVSRTSNRGNPSYTFSPWWQLLYTYLRDAETMRENALLERVIRRQTHSPKWRPQIGTLWVFPFVAIAAVLLAATSMGVGVGFAAGICAYPPYLLGSSIILLIPARVAPALSSETEARTLDLLRLTNLSTAEIVLGKLLGALIPFENLLNYVATFFILIVILGGLGAGTIPTVLDLPLDETLIAIALIELPLVFGPFANIVFFSALSLVISAYTSHPDTSIAATYGIALAYWVLTGVTLAAILVLLGNTLLQDSLLIQAYTTSPFALVYPNILRLIFSVALSPVLVHLTIRRVEQL